MTTKGDLYHVLKCPLCEGRGELEKAELLDRLEEKDLGRKLASYLDDFIMADEKESESDVAPDEHSEFKHRVDAWNCTHFLWRRSPKE